MKVPFFITLLLCLSCSQERASSLIKSLHQSNKQIVQKIHLTEDDLLILEIHYPHLLEKIILQEGLGVKDIIILHEIGLKENVLIHVLKYTDSHFILSADEVVLLQLEGVPSSVIHFMIDS
jgi:hypothetical protein